MHLRNTVFISLFPVMVTACNSPSASQETKRSFLPAVQKELLNLHQKGPCIIRRLSVNTKREGVKLLIRFDGEEIPAVNVDIADFEKRLETDYKRLTKLRINYRDHNK